MENAGSEELGPRCERFLYRGLLRPAPSVLVRPNTLVEFQGDAVEIGQGGVVIATSRRMIARAYGLTIRPGTQTQSKFEVAENGDCVFVAAQQGSVTLSDGKESSTVPEGQQTTKKKKGADAVPGATGGTFPAKTVAIVAGVEGAGALAGSQQRRQEVYKSYRRQEEMPYERPAGERKVSMKSGAYSAPP